MSASARRPGFAAFKPFEGRHAAPAAVVEETKPASTETRSTEPSTPTMIARPLRLAPSVDTKLHQLAVARGDLSLNAVVSLAIAEEWTRAFHPSTEMLADQVSALVGAAMASARYLTDTIKIPNEGVKRSSRTLRLTPGVDKKLGELATHYGGIDRNSTVAIVITSAWRRACEAPHQAHGGARG